MNSQDVRNAVYDIKFKLQAGVHDSGYRQRKPTPEEALDELLRQLRLQPVTIKPFYTKHPYGVSGAEFPHIKSHISGRHYELAWRSMTRCVECTGRDKIETGVNLGTAEGWEYFPSDEAAMDGVAFYELERGITRVF